MLRGARDHRWTLIYRGLVLSLSPAHELDADVWEIYRAQASNENHARVQNKPRRRQREREWNFARFWISRVSARIPAALGLKCHVSEYRVAACRSVKVFENFCLCGETGWKTNFKRRRFKNIEFRMYVRCWKSGLFACKRFLNAFRLYEFGWYYYYLLTAVL